MATQVTLHAEVRDDTAKGKSAAKRLRETGRVPAVVYGGDVTTTPLHVDALQLYHALHTEAGANVLIRLNFDGDEHLTIIREVQRHPVKGELVHADFQAVDRNQLIPAEIPLHIENEADPRQAGGVVNVVLYTVPIHVRPLEVPSNFTIDLAGLGIGDVVRVEDLSSQLPADATFDIEPERTVVTINAPTIIVEPTEEEEEGLGVEGDVLDVAAEAEGDAAAPAEDAE